MVSPISFPVAPVETGAHQAATQGQDQDEATVSRAKPRHHASLDFQGVNPGLGVFMYVCVSIIYIYNIYNIILYHIMLYYIILYHIISYYIILSILSIYYVMYLYIYISCYIYIYIYIYSIVYTYIYL